MAVKKFTIKIFVLLFIILILFSQKSWSKAALFALINGFESQINSTYKDLRFTSGGEIFFNNKKILLDKAESQNKQFSSYQNLRFWLGSFSPSNKLVFFIGDYKKSHSHFYMLNLNKNVAYDLGEAAKYNDIYFIGWSVDEKSLFLSYGVDNDNRGLIKIDTENMKLEAVGDVANFTKYTYLQNFLAYNTTYIYTKYIEPALGNKSTIKTSQCDSICQQNYIDFITAIDKFFIEIQKKKEEQEKLRKNNNLTTTNNGQQ